MVRTRGITFGTYNVNSLKNVLTALAVGHFVSSCNLDVLALTETKLPSDTSPPFISRCYRWYGENRSAFGSGVGILVRSTYRHRPRPDLCGSDESVWVEIDTG